MAPSPLHAMPAIPVAAPKLVARKVGKSELSAAASVVEAWGQGFNVGALILLILIVLCNYRRRVTLHKLILLEVCLL